LNRWIKIGSLDKEPHCPDPDHLTILGRIMDAQGADFPTAVNVQVVTFEEWNGEVPNEAAPEFETTSAEGYFSIRVPPGRWGVLGTAGTCNSAPLVEAIGDAGDVVGVELSLTCNQ
jgi:hypothetical protein